jgi:branched-chain amino acid transport system ATP-binding protein
MGTAELVIIDEPTEGLAPDAVAQVGRFLGRDRAPRGLDPGIVEQKLTIALKILARVYVMGQGRIVFRKGPPGPSRPRGVRKENLEV